MTSTIALRALVHVTGLDREALTNVFYEMGNVLTAVEEEVDQILDHAVSVDLGAQLLELEVTASGETEDEADRAARTAVLVAFLRTGGTFPGGDADALRWLQDPNRLGAVDLNSSEDIQIALDSAGVHVTDRELVAV